LQQRKDDKKKGQTLGIASLPSKLEFYEISRKLIVIWAAKVELGQ
jgi:hypothetical protein